MGAFLAAEGKHPHERKHLEKYRVHDLMYPVLSEIKSGRVGRISGGGRLCQLLRNVHLGRISGGGRLCQFHQESNPAGELRVALCDGSQGVVVYVCSLQPVEAKMDKSDKTLILLPHVHAVCLSCTASLLSFDALAM